MWTRQIFNISLAFILILFLAGCGSKNNKQKKQTTTPNITENSNIAKINGYILNDNNEEETDKSGILVTAYKSDLIPDINNKKIQPVKIFKPYLYPKGFIRQQQTRRVILRLKYLMVNIQ